MKKWYVRTLLVSCFFIASLWPTVPPAEGRTLKIGAIFSVTGKSRNQGEPERNTVTMVAEEINASGGVNGYPVELVQADDETSETLAVQQVKRLIEEDKVLAIVGPTISGISLKVKPLCEEAGVPMVSCAAAQAIVTPPESSRYTFKTPQLDSHVAVKLLEYIKGKGIQKIAVLSEGTVFGEQGGIQTDKYAKEAGMEVVAKETYRTIDTTMKTQLNRIQRSGAGALIIWAGMATQTVVPKNMKELGIKIPLFASHGFANPKYAATAGEAGEGIIFPGSVLLVADTLSEDHPRKKLLMAYKTAYEKRYRSPVSAFGGHAYDALKLVLRAIKDTGVNPNMDVARARELIRDELERTRGWMGTAGVFNMNPNDHTGLDKETSLTLLVVRGGKFTLLAP
jgi:branched-chain amino acid transport system substrate-binding protein